MPEFLKASGAGGGRGAPLLCRAFLPFLLRLFLLGVSKLSCSDFMKLARGGVLWCHLVRGEWKTSSASEVSEASELSEASEDLERLQNLRLVPSLVSEVSGCCVSTGSCSAGLFPWLCKWG